MNYLEEAFKLLNEDIEAVRKMYPNIDEDTFNKLIKLDPTFDVQRNSVGTYTKWLLNLYNKGKLTRDDLEEITSLLSEFEEKKKWIANKDIGQYKSIDDLKQVLDSVEVGEKSHARKIKDVRKRIHDVDLEKDANLIYEDNEWIIFSPKTYEASCKLGQDTDWCTASKEDDHYYLDYTSKGPLYILINKQNEKEKYQFHFETSSYMNKDDYPINIYKFFKENPKIYKVFGNVLLKSSFDKLGIDEKTSDDKVVELKLNNTELFYFLEDKSYREEDRIDGDDAKSILEFTSNFFDSSYYDYFDIDDFYQNNSKEIIEEIKNNKSISSSLSLKGISFEDLEDIMFNKYESNNEEQMKYANNVKECLDLSIAEAFALGAEKDAYDDVKYALENTLPKGIMTYAEDNTIIKTTVENFKNLYLFALGILGEYEEDSSVKIPNLTSAISYIIAQKFKCYEPRYGWQGFDMDAYIEDVDERLYEYD